MVSLDSVFGSSLVKGHDVDYDEEREERPSSLSENEIPSI
jgi:hypothetical protein